MAQKYIQHNRPDTTRAFLVATKRSPLVDDEVQGRRSGEREKSTKEHERTQGEAQIVENAFGIYHYLSSDRGKHWKMIFGIYYYLT